MRARLEGHVQGGPAGPVPGPGERDRLRVRAARPLVVPLPDDRAIFAHDHRTNHGVRAGSASPALGEVESAVHIFQIREHLSLGFGLWALGHHECSVTRAFRPKVHSLKPKADHHLVSNNASTYSFTSNGIRSSIDSPTPT
jgi:hypothetical protein